MGFWGWVFTIIGIVFALITISNIIDRWEASGPRSFRRLLFYWFCAVIPMLLFAWWLDSG